MEAGSTPAESIACRTAAPRASATLSGPEETGFPLPAVPSPRQRPVESTTTARVDEPPASTATSSTGQKVMSSDFATFTAGSLRRGETPQPPRKAIKEEASWRTDGRG